MGEFLRRAAASFLPAENNELLAGMIAQAEKTTAQASVAIDEALAFVEASERRSVGAAHFRHGTESR